MNSGHASNSHSSFSGSIAFHEAAEGAPGSRVRRACCQPAQVGRVGGGDWRVVLSGARAGEFLIGGSPVSYRVGLSAVGLQPRRPGGGIRVLLVAAHHRTRCLAHRLGCGCVVCIDVHWSPAQPCPASGGRPGGGCCRTLGAACSSVSNSRRLGGSAGWSGWPRHCGGDPAAIRRTRHRAAGVCAADRRACNCSG